MVHSNGNRGHRCPSPIGNPDTRAYLEKVALGLVNLQKFCLENGLPGATVYKLHVNNVTHLAKRASQGT
jgi:hypothetical protein